MPECPTDENGVYCSTIPYLLLTVISMYVFLKRYSLCDIKYYAKQMRAFKITICGQYYSPRVNNSLSYKFQRIYWVWFFLMN